MLAGFFHGIVSDRKLLREAQVNIAIRWFVGYGLDDQLPDHSSLTRIHQRWGVERCRRVFERRPSDYIVATAGWSRSLTPKPRTGMDCGGR